MDYDDFIDKYMPVKNTLDEQAGFDGMLFETFGDEFDFVTKAGHVDECKVWSLIEMPNGRLVIVNGLWILDCVGFFVCRISYKGKKGQLKVPIDQDDDD